MANQIQNVELTSRGIKKVLNKYTPERAIAEYIWNGFDAHATEVRITYSIETNFNGITRIEVADNGDGIKYEELPVVFKKFYESQKTISGNLDSRFSRGKNGYGRFTFFRLSKKATWETVYMRNDETAAYNIEMTADNLNSYKASNPEVVKYVERGTKVTFDGFSDSDLSLEWVEENLIPYLKTEMAWYFKVYPNKRLYINNKVLDCSSVIADSEVFKLPIELPGIAPELFHCTYFQWKEKPQEECSRFYFMDTDGNLKHQTTTLLNRKGDSFWHSILITSTIYNHLSDYISSTSRTLFSDTAENKVQKALIDQLNDYLRNKRRPFLKAQANILVDKYENEKLFDFIGTSTWEQQHKNYLQGFIKELYEVEPAVFAKLNETQKKIFIRLLDQIMDTDKNDSLFTILGEVIELEEEDRNRFSKILETTRLKNVISTIQLINDRLLTISDLKAINFDHTLKAGEVAHLQKLIESHYWIFGEEYRFVCAEEVKFQEALARYHYILRGASKKEYIEHPNKYKEMDLFITGKDHREGRPSNLVVEIKNPTNVPLLRMIQYSQIADYMDVIMEEDMFNASGEYWTFMLIGLELDSAIKRQMSNPLTGLCIDDRNCRLYVKTWSQVLNEAEGRMNYLKEKLQLERDKLSAAGTLDEIMFEALHNTAMATDVNKRKN